MDDHAVPSISAAEAETFFTDGFDARHASTPQPEPIDHPVDVPGVGMRPASELPATLRGRDQVAGEVPPTLRAFVECAGAGLTPEHTAQIRKLDRYAERELLLSQLIFASRDLAQKSLVGQGPGAYCTECGLAYGMAGTEALVHGLRCCTGRVVAVLAALVALAEVEAESMAQVSALLVRKAEAPAGSDLRCFACEVFGGEWIRGERVDYQATSVKKNQRVAECGSDGCVYLYTHVCASQGGAQ